MDTVQQAAQPERRRFWSPIGRLTKPRVVLIHPADRQRWPIGLNRYPRQVIGVAIRLPSCDQGVSDYRPHHSSLSIVWAKPARWWKR